MSELNNTLFHCSGLYNIMTEPKGRSNLEKYNDFVDKKEKADDRYLELFQKMRMVENKQTKTYKDMERVLKNHSKKIDDFDKQIKEIEPFKDEKPLSDTCKKYLMKIFVEHVYGRTYDIHSKYMLKGTVLEEEGIDTYAFVTETFFQKNKITKDNGYVIGTIDFPKEFIVIYDTKLSWNIFTFWDTHATGLTDAQYWQAQGYMWLWGIDKAKIVKVLLDTPQKLIEKEKKYLLDEFVGTEEAYAEACKEIEKRHTYSDIPIQERVMELVVHRNDEDIERIAPRVIECREYLQKVYNYKGRYYEQMDRTE